MGNEGIEEGQCEIGVAGWTDFEDMAEYRTDGYQNIPLVISRSVDLRDER